LPQSRVGAYIGSIVTTLAALHPLEYVAMNALAGGTRGAHGRFELDYLSAAATEALRRLEHRLDYDVSPGRNAPDTSRGTNGPYGRLSECVPLKG